MRKKTIQNEETEHLITQIRVNLIHIESLADESKLDFFKPSQCAKLRSLVKRLTMRIENHSG